jgi:DNA-binding transcriptional LysR family regulator
MDLRQLRSFVVLAEELHFGRAASRLGITQPSLSQQLQQLEIELGMALVERTSRRVSLTEAGSVLLQGANRTLAEANRAAAAVHDLRSGRAGRLVIGSLGAGLNGPLPGILRRARASGTPFTIHARHFADSASQERELLAGTLDIALLREVSHHRAIESRELLSESFVAYVPSGDPLAAHSQISLDDLADHPFVLWPRHLGESFYDIIIDACHRHGFTPVIAGVGDSLEAQLALVAAGVGVSVQAASNESLARTGATMVRLAPTGISAQLRVAYNKWRQSPAITQFLSALP